MSTCFIDFRATKFEKEKLSKEGLDIITVPKCDILYDAICGHPDIQLCIESNNIVVAKNSKLNIDSLYIKEFPLIASSKELGSKYPSNIFLNAVNLSNFFIHNLNFTDEELLKLVSHKELINIKQGYSKCSCAIISDNALITSDIKTFETLKKYPIDVLFVPCGDIVLEGFDYGFIGGSCGLISKDKIAFFGDINNHPSSYEIKKFLYKHDVEPISLSSGPLIDRGSILTLF